MKRNKKTVILLSLVLILLVLWITGIVGLLSSGMTWVANNSKLSGSSEGFIVQGEYSIVISLDDLASNVGKEIFNDGKHRIYVNWIDNKDGYTIGFRSSGQYSLFGASLVSGIHHKTLGDRLFTSEISATMIAEYNGKQYSSTMIGLSGLNYKDGDDFLFYIFPSECYDKGEINIDEKGTVKLTITNLYMNVWFRV